MPELDTEPPAGDVTVMGVLAARMRMTEGQLYTALIAVIMAVLLALTGLPNAHQRTHSTTSGVRSPSAGPVAP